MIPPPLGPFVHACPEEGREVVTRDRSCACEYGHGSARFREIAIFSWHPSPSPSPSRSFWEGVIPAESDPLTKFVGRFLIAAGLNSRIVYGTALRAVSPKTSS